MEHLQIPSTKVDPIQTEAFYLEILETLATRMVAHAGSIDALAEAVTALQSRADRAAERQAAEQAEAEADEAKADDK